MSLFPRDSTDQSPLTQSLVQKSEAGALYHGASLIFARSTFLQLSGYSRPVSALCKGFLLLDLNPTLSPLSISFGGT